MNRGSGILMHISSLPGKYGIGTFGNEAYTFADFLKEANQKYWQILPLCPTSYGDSPYQAPSAFALNPYFIDFDSLIREGLLKTEDLHGMDFGNDIHKVDYGKIYKNNEKVLRKAFARSKEALASEIEDFASLHWSWLEDYSLYMVLKTHFKLVEWRFWDEDIKRRDPSAIAFYKEKYREEILYFKFVQYIAYKQWFSLKEYINKQGIQVIGDLPIYAAGDSADTWANANAGIFKFDADLNPLCVAGCPPDYFCADGQYWGNIVYDWPGNKAARYGWWISRIKSALTLCDWIRIDHFRGLESYWEIPFDSATAAIGSWQAGPGIDFINAIKEALGDVKIIAEDLGFMTYEVRKLLKDSDFPGMKVLEFAFDSCCDNDHLPHNYDKNCVVYTSTHDNDTVCGWFKHSSKSSRAFAKKYLKLCFKEGFNWAMIRGALSSPANLAIIPMQDLLGLGSEARMNTPSTFGGNNWRWRMEKSAMSGKPAKKLAELTRIYCR